MKRLLIISFIIFACSMNASNMHDFLAFTDLSPVLMKHQDMRYGYIGDNYQRLYVYFTDIRKETADRYNVYGKSKVCKNICSFDGDIKIVSVDSAKVLQSCADGNTPQYYTCYTVKAEYTLTEHGERGTGVFKGIMTSKITIVNGMAYYDENGLECCDSYCNNQFTGVWQSASKHLIKKCCWGDYRIPDCGDLDTGAAEFIPNTKYLKYGWQSFMDAYMSGTAESWKKENCQWWNE